MSFDFKMRSMRRIKLSKKRLSNVHHQSKMRNMWRILWCLKQELSHTSTEDEEDEIDENQRNFILFCQADVDQTRCHALFVFSRDSFFTQQCRKKRISRVLERFSERFSEQNSVFRISIIKIRFVLFRCCLRLRWPLRCHSRRRLHTVFYDLSHDLVNTSELTDNNDANEKTKSTNNHSIQRRLAAHLIEIQAQANRNVLKRRLYIHRFSTCLEQKSRQIH